MLNTQIPTTASNGNTTATATTNGNAITPTNSETNTANTITPATNHQHDGNPTPAMLHAHEQTHLLCEVRYAMAQIDDVFSVCLNYPIGEGEQETLYYMAWHRLNHAQKMLGKLDELLQGGAK